MDEKKRLDDLFGPKDSAAVVFGSIFPAPSSTVGGRDSRNGTLGNKKKGGESSGNKNENGTVEGSYYSSSIYYGGQENYSLRARTTGSHPLLFKDRDYDDDGAGENSSNSASRGNWWQGSLYY